MFVQERDFTASEREKAFILNSKNVINKYVSE